MSKPKRIGETLIKVTVSDGPRQEAGNQLSCLCRLELPRRAQPAVCPQDSRETAPAFELLTPREVDDLINALQWYREARG